MADDLDRSYYVYLHIDNATGSPFYVGKGKMTDPHRGRKAEPWVLPER